MLSYYTNYHMKLCFCTFIHRRAISPNDIRGWVIWSNLCTSQGRAYSIGNGQQHCANSYGVQIQQSRNCCMFYFVTTMFRVLTGDIFTFVFQNNAPGTGTIECILHDQWHKPQIQRLNRPLLYRNKPQVNMSHAHISVKLLFLTL